MTNTKWLRRALLGGAALGVMASGAQADELSALKAQLEALQSRVSQIESQPAPTLPPGTRLLTVRKGLGSYAEVLPMRASEQLREHQGYTIAVTPTADMPAPVSEVTVSGEIRARLLYTDEHTDDGTGIDLNANDFFDGGAEASGFDTNFWDVITRGRLRIDGKTQTAIGEVGGTIRLQAQDGGTDAVMNIIWGYWQMTPNLQLGAGYTDSLAAIQASVDWNGNAVLNGFFAGPTNQSVSQFRLTYTSGGLTLAASVEDNTNADIPAVAAYIGFDTGSFLINANAIWEQDDSTSANGIAYNDTEDNWMVGVGAIAHLGDMLRVEAAANKGNGYTAGVFGLSNSGTVLVSSGENDMEYWSASVLAVLSFASNMSLELDGGYSDLNHEDDEIVNDANQVGKLWSLGAALYWDPVDQLTLGWGVGWNKREAEGGGGFDPSDNRDITAGFGAWFRF